MSTPAAYRVYLPPGEGVSEETIWSHRRGSGLATVVDGIRVIRLVGCCSHGDFLELCHMIPQWKRRNRGGLIIDFSATKWHDLVGVRCLVKALVWAQEEGDMRVCLVRPPLDVRVVLRYMVPRSPIGYVSTLGHGLEQVRKPAVLHSRSSTDALAAALPSANRGDWY